MHGFFAGRRMDQGEKRTAIDVWEADSKIFNPLADWSWEDVRGGLLHMPTASCPAHLLSTSLLTLPLGDIG